jgi:feruloyl esterase
MKVLLATCCAFLLAAAPAFAAGRSCESLASLTLPQTTISAAQPVAAGAFTPPDGGARGGGAPNNAFKTLPAFCRVAATLAPSSDSDIKVEVWLPASGWNGKFVAVGNGGFSGSISYPAMADALGRGYATASTDTGHAGNSASFALDHPEKLIDFAWRSEHEMTVKAKAIIATFYGDAPKFSYWNGCSAGGRQALKEAQRFPEDFNGIIAGAPGSDWTGRASAALRVAQAMHKDEASNIPAAKYPVIHAAVLEACDALDGVKDGVIENPRSCTFDPQVLECKGADTASCLTKPQVEMARTIYAPAKSGREITSLEPGSELGWATWGGAQPLSQSTEHFKYIVLKDPNWDFKTFNFERDAARADQIDNGTVNALDPNLKPFFDRGGKLLQYHGWGDPQISPGNSVQYYSSVVKTLGGREAIHASYRMFMVPGMAHCGGGDGPNRFDMITALEQWVEKGQAPDRIEASRLRDGKVDRTRPLCPYPQVATYKGTGSTDEAVNFVCKAATAAQPSAQRR